MINLNEVREFYNNTQKGRASFQQKLDKKQAQIANEVQGLKSLVSGLQSTDDLWMKALTESWVQLITEASDGLAKMSKMREFNKQFDGLIFMVAGAVNSGKSTLGNFISGQDFSSLGSKAPYTNDQSAFSIFDSNSNQRRPTTHFEEKATECTASIQAFELNKAFTWVDTPGLASLTRENGDLAKRYIEGSDLVIFVMSSDAPMTREDAETLKSLGIDQGKPFSILVTKFDKMESEWCDKKDDIVQKRVPKDETSRRDQERYILEQLKEVELSEYARRLNKDSLIFFSKYCAADAIKTNNPTLWEESGAPKVFSLFNHILESEAVELKRLSPIKNYNAFLRGLVDGHVSQTGDQNRSFSDLLSEADKLKKRLSDEKQKFSDALRRKQGLVVMEASNRATALIRDSLSTSNQTALAQQLQDTLVEVLDQTITPFVREKLSEVLSQENPHLTIDPIQVTIDKIENVYSSVSYAAPSRSAKRGGFGALIGGAIGMLGGPVGAMIGSAIGAGLGSTMGTDKMKTKDIKVGDNSHEVMARAIEDFEKEVLARLNPHFDKLVEATFGEALNRLQSAISELDQSKQRLNNLYMTEKL